MTKFSAVDAFDQLNNRPALLQHAFMMTAPAKEGTYEPSMLGAALARLAQADADDEIKAADTRKAHLLAAYGFPSNSLDQKPFAFANGMAIIPISGILINRFPYSFGYVTGYNFIRSQLNAALADDDVTAIVFDVNSPGGACAGCMELAEEIYQSRSVKPSLAMVDASCYSAAYWLGSSATRVVVTPSGGVGSIGVLAGRLDITKMMADFGVEMNWVIAGANKLDSNPMAKFSDAARARLQASVDSAYADFVQAVARNRGMTAESVAATEATCYDAADALKIGLVDSVAAPNAVVEELDAYLTPPDDDDEDDDTGDGFDQSQRRNQDMTTKPEANAAAVTTEAITQAASADIAAQARTAERQRIASIMNCEEAAGREKLARHLAENTDASPEQARAILGAAAKETPVAATSETNHFANAMDAVRQPNVQGGTAGMPGNGADGSGAGANNPEAPEAKTSGILAAHFKATGRKAEVAGAGR